MKPLDHGKAKDEESDEGGDSARTKRGSGQGRNQREPKEPKPKKVKTQEVWKNKLWKTSLTGAGQNEIDQGYQGVPDSA